MTLSDVPFNWALSKRWGTFRLSPVFRVEKAKGSTGTLYWYMTPGIVAESDLLGNLQSEYVFFDGERVARKDFPSNAVSYYFSDHLKTADVITDSAGNIKSESDYYPWGGELSLVANDSNHYKFTGKERDAETQFDYFGARYYSSGLGRFITPDWAAKPVPVPYADLSDPQSLNQYTYVRNVPTSRFDADGHDDLDAARKRAIDQAWKQEQELVAQTGQGTYKWTAAQKAELLRTARVKGFWGHHINSVKGFPELAGNPNNVEWVMGRAGNLAKHGGDFHNVTKGVLLNRSLVVVGVGVSVYNIATSPPGQKAETAMHEARGWAGATAGGEAGALFGVRFGPLGAAVGGVIGAVGGAISGQNIFGPVPEKCCQ